MLFPQLKGQRYGYVNLEREAVRRTKMGRRRAGENPLLVPAKCQELLDEIHQQASLAWSFGGWMENRPNLWSGSYLQQKRTYLHLGVDYNVGEGVEVALPWEAKVVKCDHDGDLEGGWGGRIIVEPTKKYLADLFFVFAHLSDDLVVREEQILKAGEIIGVVGLPEVNGGWFSHLHVQAVTREELKRAMENDLAEFDGYGEKAKQSRLALRFPDPTPYIYLG